MVLAKSVSMIPKCSSIVKQTQCLVLYLYLCARHVNIRMSNYVITGRVLSQMVSHWLFAEAGFDLELFRVGFVADRVALGQVFSEYFGFFSTSVPFHQLHTHSFI